MIIRFTKMAQGEGEVKMYLDGDIKDPTKVGTGTEDYISTAQVRESFKISIRVVWLVDDSLRHFLFL
ncbi:MAG: DUF2961 domain-containing protein [Saprospiraceae bacterium]|nr:DUF2961 domain-containing protein [Saprospiraceae bacterium]